MPQASSSGPLAVRTRQFALSILRFCSGLPPGEEVRVIRHQMARSGTSVGANYRAACRARSRKEFVAKLGIVEEEADETGYWLDLLLDLTPARLDATTARDLLAESDEIVAMVVRSIQTARKHSWATGRSPL